ncbi:MULTISPECIES: LacI family DNA-binding transcriptional regulator [Brevibacillus]|uniref:LacI family DNA-binding transcriptional regulator n=1 Tax=Brevibacillus invocatus TaxID=173959 RepID=A0A3M8CLP7_9BACL|nr:MULTISPECIES: LacI family DNA-binding transcriptional regulator [Brevibacillus]MCM3078286.1 LacI family DNA-binding transcriptional regulator [Brevibacillus invocatus]MCM3428559.1 LacI family DNA-binding transcriptional regulator [Brevibacillus invocatus]MDH4616932.1 LacI family DNA-binding transcriptional regulator [Brevibacillus sp. AY1]RNB76197.1 LacI family DNA-binding transcriptional regulator [Brevibacillus invocatus]
MNKKKRARVTLQQVADHAGVSKTTASLIVRNKVQNISEATQKRVLAAMSDLGYVYDRVAANLRSQSSSTVGMIITEIANPYFSELLEGVHQELDKHGYTVLLGTTSESGAKQDSLLSTMLEYRVSGVILCPATKSSLDTINRLEKWGIPVILIGKEISGADCDYVGVDFAPGSKVAVEHLISAGHRRIALLGGPTEASSWKARKEGYGQAFQEAGLSVDETLMVGSPMTRDGGLNAVRQLLKHPDPPTAIFCYNDVIAFGAMVGLQEAGLTPGQDIAVVGFDNLKEAATSIPSLTTVSSCPQLIGTYAADLLHQRIMGLDIEPQRIIIKPELIVRTSSSWIKSETNE